MKAPNTPRDRVRVAAYCRVSTDREDQAHSLESQRRYFQEWIQRNPAWELCHIYADQGISGTSTQRRRQFRAMMDQARAGGIDLIITKEVSRFARNTLDALQYTRELGRYGVGVLFLNDGIDTRQQEGELRLAIMASIAQEESRRTSQRVKWGQTRRMEQGVVFGGPLLGYDVVDGKIAVNPEGARTVRRIFHKYLTEGKGASVIARELRQEGIASTRGSCKWSAATVLKILKNEKYCGDLIQKKTYTPDYLTHQKKYNHGQEAMVILRDHHEPILDRATWEAAQQERMRRCRCEGSRPGHGNRYPLSGKILCGCCGSGFVARKKKTASGAFYRVWRCGKAAAQGSARRDFQGIDWGCGIGRQLREDAALEMLRQAVDTAAPDAACLTEELARVVETVLAGEETAEEERRSLLREQEREIGRKRRAMEAFYGQEITEEDFRYLEQGCNRRIAQLEAQLEKNAARSPAWDVRAEIAGILRDAGAEGFRTRLLERMTVYPDGRVAVALRQLPVQWIFTIAGGAGSL